MLVLVVAALIPFVALLFIIALSGLIFSALKTGKKDENTALPYLLCMYAVSIAGLLAVGESVYAMVK